jgi:hypothetical protein
VTAPQPSRGHDQGSAASSAHAAGFPGDRPPGVIACWSAKGGAGTTVVATALALRLARLSPAGALLVDGAGDVPGVLGLPEPDRPGLAEWLRRASADPLHEVPACPGLSVVPRGDGHLEVGRADDLAAFLDHDTRPVVVDCGTAPEGATAVMAARADQSILVTRPCYLALRRALWDSLPRPTGVIVVREPGRVLEPHDVAAAIGAPILAEIAYDPAVARAVDAGLLASRLPRSLDASLANARILTAGASIDRPGAPGPPSAAVDVTGSDTPEASAW